MSDTQLLSVYVVRELGRYQIRLGQPPSGTEYLYQITGNDPEFIQGEAARWIDRQGESQRQECAVSV